MNGALPALVVAVLVVALGFRWYERSRPSARTLALVATLAALAALGRIAFAAVPNVKPTTDIVVLAGLALGAAPGFVVGATAAITSNVVFGQGPDTAWQMLAWGCCGLVGAGLGVVVRGAVNRWLLAAVCGTAGLLFGAIMNFSIWVSYTDAGSDQALALAASAAPFDAAHAIGNVVFALAFGPAMLVALRRARHRLEGRFADELPAPRPDARPEPPMPRSPEVQP